MLVIHEISKFILKKKYLPRRNDRKGEIWIGNHEYSCPYEKFDRY